mmetsp:Transcript_7582/g.12759  ORF Transcript_7582/g.12759 Transcript_7582/m.12759 type:complete len:210 (-) Transcript_7582:111-740(-)|eukprot:CAMPEP_0114434700 /NCGR_PEP_ID=MMETSP0103-20121206/12409_1 /TAXON_ID=37642 ORGANISM="Paraphysomonas imperforata, Strain PA2" /NCGR_SAMPLE_ID=MMETSP0103 /ASSEMBLY_ACC=CAM_ASM_000201 /LENGTH=209 /DNA_ID=CAMNT_0001604621 /DNA_START=18 /DNA_END=647 /DNA_ORIENTATION=+
MSEVEKSQHEDEHEEPKEEENNEQAIKLQNVVATVNLGVNIDLEKLAQTVSNAEYNPRRFAAVIMRIREPRTTALVFHSGKMIVTGAATEADSRMGARKYVHIIQKVGFAATYRDYKIQNLTATCDMGFPIRLEGLVYAHSQHATYEPELFPGLVYKMTNPKVVFLVFVSGKVVVTGAKSEKIIEDGFETLYPYLAEFRKESSLLTVTS